MTRPPRKQRADEPTFGSLAAALREKAGEIASLRQTSQPVAKEQPAAQPQVARKPEIRTISPEEAMQLAFEQSEGARSRKFLSEGLQLDGITIAGDAPTARDRDKPTLEADDVFRHELRGTKPLRRH